VAGTEVLNPRLYRVTLAGPSLEGLVIDQPAASLRVLLPSPEGTALAIPDWTGNQFLFPDGSRPTIRTLTPRRFDASLLELDIYVVVHGQGAASEWAEKAQPGAEVAVSGPARGYSIDPDASSYLLAGDETAIPAIGQLLEHLPPEAAGVVHIEAAAPSALPAKPGVAINWVRPGPVPGEMLFGAVRDADLPAETRVWVAGEAAAVQRIRRHLFEDRKVPRTHATVRGYWKHGRAGEHEGA
jgi:NADPH-dependent ferric siderophore reductase